MALRSLLRRFANDIANEGGGYIVVGVKEVNGQPVRPVKGISIEEIEPIGKKMVEYNNLINPAYFPKTSVEDIDGKKVLQSMDLLAGPKEAIYPKNVALMMFNEHPEKFFPCTQVDIVSLPGGKREDPNNFVEVPPIVGPIDSIFDKTMAYLDTNVRKLMVKKVGTKSESDKAWNYPRAALEEIVANCLYHRDYRQREPIEIQVEPRELRFISYGGPDRSVRLQDFESGMVNPRRYRNRRIGDFLKELDITEGKSTGVPTIVDAMKENGSPAVKFEFDEERTWFMVTVPVHEWFLEDDPVNDPVNDPVKILQEPLDLTARQLKIVAMIEENDRVTREEMMMRCDVSMPTIKRDIAYMKKVGVLIRVGSDKTGCWMIARKVK